VAVNCGPGECKKDEGFHYHCECEKGYRNMLNNTKFPCIDDNCKARSIMTHQCNDDDLP
jgi:hypothetical protein